MIKKLFGLVSLPLLITSFSFVSCKGNNPSYDEFMSYINNLGKFPCSFVYNGESYQGLNKLNLISHENNKVGVKEQHILTFNLDTIKIIVDANYYDGYDAFDWTIYFKNDSNTNSKVISNLNGLDYTIEGANARLKGIYGDHEQKYAPYDFNLSRDCVDWRNDLGRASHRYFPYFNLENDNGGAIMALGWAGTWHANFTYDKASKKTNAKFNAVLDLATYLKPGETIRTSLNAIVRYYQKDEDAAMNKWRRWYIDCNMPYNDKSHTKKAQPMQAFCLATDNNNPFSDGSISETYKTYEQSLSYLYEQGVRVDVRWFDAGWYVRPDNVITPINNVSEWKTNFLDWWGTVGTWKMDEGKWPIEDGVSSFKKSVDYAADHGTMTMVWYEPERVAKNDEGRLFLTDLINNYGFKLEWLLAPKKDDDIHTNIVNLGNADAYTWVKNKIIESLITYGIKIYREDYNCDPGIQFRKTDIERQGENRTGITENLYYQNHYKLWDEIIKVTSEINNGCAFVDACAEGGGRNDLESMRRGVPMLRSDDDRAKIPLRLSFSYSLNPWLPFTGCSAKESDTVLAGGDWDQYILRASYMGVMTYGSRFFLDKSKLDYNILRAAQREWETINPYFYKDYYNLTPYTLTTDDTHWNAYMYFDKEKNDGVIQVFRQKNSSDNTYLLKIKGVYNNRNYKIVDNENKNGIESISGAKLKEGITITLDQPRSSSVLYIKPL